MKTLQDWTEPAERQDLKADLEARVETVFERCPALWGFSIAERLVPSKDADAGVREWELYVSNIDAYPELGSAQAEMLCGEISGAFADLLDQRPEAAELLPGRTFARMWH
jgi:hypothetical protein